MPSKKHLDQVIEAERLLTKLVAISKRVHGPDHQLTKKAESDLQFQKVRYVDVTRNDKWERFQALRYDESGKKCILQGPITDECSRNVQEERTLTVATEDILFADGTPVICHGLKDAMSHLNGKIGDARCFVEENNTYEVHFEDKSVQLCLLYRGATALSVFVKPENLRILFELPDE